MQKAIAVISDIHSDFEALTAVLEDVKSRQVSKIVCLGDVVGYASGVRACLRAIRELGCPVVMGNHDEAACLPEPPEDFNDTAYAGIEFAASRLTKSGRTWMTSLPRNLEKDHPRRPPPLHRPEVVTGPVILEPERNHQGHKGHQGRGEMPSLWV